MIDNSTARGQAIAAIGAVSRAITMFARHIAPPMMRIALALPFLRSGLTRWDAFPSLSLGTIYLFEEQFRLHILGGEYTLPAPDQFALATAIAEIALPVLLIAGLGTRLSAFGLLLMTGVIQLVVPDGWANFHLYWAALALGIIATGPGMFSLDDALGKLLARAAR